MSESKDEFILKSSVKCFSETQLNEIKEISDQQCYFFYNNKKSPASLDIQRLKRELELSHKKITYFEKKYELFEDNVKSIERNIIATMGIIFSFFITIASTNDVLQWISKTSWQDSLKLILGVCFVNIVMIGFLVFLIKWLWRTKESTNKRVDNREETEDEYC